MPVLMTCIGHYPDHDYQLFIPEGMTETEARATFMKVITEVKQATPDWEEDGFDSFWEPLMAAGFTEVENICSPVWDLPLPEA